MRARSVFASVLLLILYGCGDSEGSRSTEIASATATATKSVSSTEAPTVATAKASPSASPTPTPRPTGCHGYIDCPIGSSYCVRRDIGQCETGATPTPDRTPTCSVDSECNGNTVCDFRKPVPCGDPSGFNTVRACIRGCTVDRECQEGQRCNDAHHCVAKECATANDCPAQFQCDPAGCARQPCSKDQDCSSGFCVYGHCFSEPGICLPYPA